MKIKMKSASTIFLTIILSSCAISHKKVEFRFDSTSREECDENSYQISNLGVSSVQWIAPNTLKIEALVLINCAYKITKCNIDIEEDIINVEYLARNPNDGFFKRTVAACQCTNKLSLEINNLEQKKYKINLMKQKK